MIEFIIWIISLFVLGAIMMKYRGTPTTWAAGVAHIIVGLGACLGLYLHVDTAALTFIFNFMANWYVLEVFIFLNIVTGYAFYESRVYRKRS